MAVASSRFVAPLANRPLVTYGLDALRKCGVQDVAICANGDTGVLRKVLGRGESVGLRLHYVEERLPRGPAGCVKDAATVLGEDDCFVVMEAGLLTDACLKEFLACHRRSGAALTIGVDGSNPPAQSGEDDSREILGIYAVAPAALPHIANVGYQDIKGNLVNRLHQSGAGVRSHALRGFTSRVTGAESYLALNDWVLEQLTQGTWTLPGYRQQGELFLHPTAEVASTARFVGPVVVGPDSVVQDDAVIVGPASIGQDCTIESEAILSFSVAWNNVTVGRQSYVSESVLANGTRTPRNARVVGKVRVSNHGQQN